MPGVGETVDDGLQVSHARRQQDTAEDGLRAVAYSLLEPLDVTVRAEVHHLIAGRPEHHDHEIFPDVVRVALNHADANFVRFGVAPFDEEGLDDFQRRLHGPSADEQVRHVHLVPREAVTEVVHRGDHGVMKQLEYVRAVLSSLRNEMAGPVSVTGKDRVIDFKIPGHEHAPWTLNLPHFRRKAVRRSAMGESAGG